MKLSGTLALRAARTAVERRVRLRVGLDAGLGGGRGHDQAQVLRDVLGAGDERGDLLLLADLPVDETLDVPGGRCPG